ncbi:MAG: 2-hydroxy-3-oxopropionate reductase [Dehalococcoidia bacterium]|nr:2-hydroxy-3-oxopropionate reductase [Dehalococcoidia bacterium]
MGAVQRIGFIGLGIMGKPMALNLLAAGYTLTVYNRTQSKTVALEQAGAKLASSPKQVSENSDVIITMVSDSPDVQEIVLGSHGILEGICHNSIVIDMSTISPSMTKTLSQRLSEKGASMLDAPVSGSSWAAEDGTLSIMVGGDKEIFEKCLPIFETLGKTIVHIGPIGMGQVCKLVNQVIVAGTLASVCEGLLLGSKSGVDLENVFQAITGGAANSWQLENLGSRIIKRDFDPGFTVKLMLKDQRLINQASEELELPMPVSSIARQFFYILGQKGLGEEGTQSYIKALEEIGETEVK